jgi:hypothetical protein
MSDFRKESFAIVTNRDLFVFMTDVRGREWFNCSIGPAWSQCVYVDVANVLDTGWDMPKDVELLLEKALNEGIYHLLAVTY